MGKDTPDKGINHSGEWFKGKKDSEGNEIDCSHKNARYTIRLDALENIDPRANDPAGVPVQAIIYGGRDSDTTIPVVESLSWSHGVFLGATVESETTSATIGAQGIRKHNPMANLDFISVPIKIYIENHLKFINGLEEIPRIYATNYFLKDESGNYLNSKLDKKVWVLWAEGRVHHEFEAIETPVGRIPKYEDLKTLFIRELNKNYTKAEYLQQFSLRVTKYLEKVERMSKIFENIEMPAAFSEELKAQTERLRETRSKFRRRYNFSF